VDRAAAQLRAKAHRPLLAREMHLLSRARGRQQVMPPATHLRQMRLVRRTILVLVLVYASLLLYPRPAVAYSVLAHEAVVDSMWDDVVAGLLRQRFPGVSPAELEKARAFAYGGSLIQDLGYYPLGSHLFTNLTHYVRSGDFVEALIRDAQDVNEYAFALGSLAHYASDNTGHPIAVNRAVPLVYPKIRRKVGDVALYADSPARHLMVEFAFDVLQVARGEYASQEYRKRVGFEVSKPLLERAFRETYALELKDLFVNVDLAIGTYRRAIGTTIPEMTRIAWREKRQEIEKVTPGVERGAFVFTLSGREYDRQFGTEYYKPGLLARCVAFLVKIVPKVGPFRALAFRPLTPEAERLFLESVTAARTRYRRALEAVGQRRLNLANSDFDTGERPAPGKNPLADETYAELLKKLEDGKFAGVPVELTRDINSHFAAAAVTASGSDGATTKEEKRIRRRLAALNASASGEPSNAAQELHR
jgi:hypothetical protein